MGYLMPDDDHNKDELCTCGDDYEHVHVEMSDDEKDEFKRVMMQFVEEHRARSMELLEEMHRKIAEMGLPDMHWCLDGCDCPSQWPDVVYEDALDEEYVSDE